MRFLLVVWSVCVLASCTKTNGPLKLYFISSARFTSGNKTGVGAGDTLSTRLFAAAATGNTLRHFNVTVTYSPQRAPFAYPASITAFNYRALASDSTITYLDSTLTSAPVEFLYTSVFGARTTSGTEKWVYTATDKDGNTSARSFTLAVRRGDSLNVYHDYTLKLPSSGYSSAAPRFAELNSGIVYPGYSLVGQVPSPGLQRRIDLVLLPDGQRFASPDDKSVVLNGKWMGARRGTRFYLTGLSPTDFGSAQDTVTIQQQFVKPGVSLVSGLVVNQVYAFRTADTPHYFGLLLIKSLPSGTTAGLQMQVRVAKHHL